MCKVGSSPVTTTLGCLLCEVDVPRGRWCCSLRFSRRVESFLVFPVPVDFFDNEFLTGDCSPFNVILPVQLFYYCFALLLLLT